MEEGYKPLKGDMGPGMGMGVEVRIHRGAGVDYVQKGPPESKGLKTTDPDETVEVAGFVLVNELDGDLQEHARNLRVGGKIERWVVQSWERRAEGMEICRSLLAKQNHVVPRKILKSGAG